MKKCFLLFIAAVIFVCMVSPIFLSAEGTEQELSCFDLSERYRAKIPITVIEKVPLPKGYKEGLFLNGPDIWVNNGQKINTWIISPDGSLAGEIVPPATFTEGLTESSLSGKYWVTDWDTKKLYRVSIELGKMIPDMEISFVPSMPTGVVRVGEKLYVITWTRGLGTKYHLLQLDENGKILLKMRIKNISEPSQLTWDGGHLWITSWYNQKVYQVDPGSFKVIGHFNSPAKQTTGIAWDGQHFWVTGTYDDLYKIKVEK